MVDNRAHTVSTLTIQKYVLNKFMTMKACLQNAWHYDKQIIELVFPENNKDIDSALVLLFYQKGQWHKKVCGKSRNTPTCIVLNLMCLVHCHWLE